MVEEVPILWADSAKGQFLFPLAPKSSMTRAVANLGIPYSTIQSILQNLVYMIAYKINRAIRYKHKNMSS